MISPLIQAMYDPGKNIYSAIYEDIYYWYKSKDLFEYQTTGW